MRISGWAITTFLVVGGAFVIWNATKPGSALQGRTMTPTDTSAISEGSPIVQVALPLELSGDARIGQRVFEAKCAACHGENAAGTNGVAPPLVHKIYEPGHHSDVAFVRAARNGVRSHHWNFGDMPPVEGLTDGEVKYVARYIRELQRENGID